MRNNGEASWSSPCQVNLAMPTLYKVLWDSVALLSISLDHPTYFHCIILWVCLSIHYCLFSIQKGNNPLLYVISLSSISITCGQQNIKWKILEVNSKFQTECHLSRVITSPGTFSELLGSGIIPLFSVSKLPVPPACISLIAVLILSSNRSTENPPRSEGSLTRTLWSYLFRPLGLLVAFCVFLLLTQYLVITSVPVNHALSSSFQW